MMPPTDQLETIQRGLLQPGRPSSDYDLNADVVLSKDRKITPAAVLIGIVETDAGLEVILTKRSPRLKHHPGQIAFPGGKQDPGDKDLVSTALREAMEEIGLPDQGAHVLGQMAPHETVTGFSVTPVLATVETGFVPELELGEVSEAFTVPLSHILEPSNYIVEGRRWRGTQRYYFTVPYGPYYIWGATARILRALTDQIAAS